MNFFLHLILLILFSFAASNSNQNGNFLVITDIHIDEKYNKNGNRSEMCHLDENSENQTPKEARDAGGKDAIGAYGDRKCDSPPVYILFYIRKNTFLDCLLECFLNVTKAIFSFPVAVDYSLHFT